MKWVRRAARRLKWMVSSKKAMIAHTLPVMKSGVSIPAFRQKAKPGSFSFQTRNGYRFFDGLDHLGDFFILKDRKNRDRFLMSYSIKDDRIQIQFIQRDYSGITRRLLARALNFTDNSNRPIRWWETLAAKKFKQELGVHPAEFLLSEFIYRMRDRIRAGVPVFISRQYGEKIHNYAPLLERFFEKNSRSGYYKLSLKKRRVTELVNAP